MTADPVIDKVLDESKSNDTIDILHVGVGGRDAWKDPKCVFRTDARTRLRSVPTLIRWGTPARIEEEKCANEAMIKMLLEEED